jgi:hypothetical protein
MQGQWNFNSHPELDDTDFATAALNVFNGSPPTKQSVQDAKSAILGSGGGAAGRYALIDGWISQGFDGNADDNWFRNIPSWAWVILVPVAAGIGLICVWKAYGGVIKDVTSGNGSGGNGY